MKWDTFEKNIERTLPFRKNISSNLSYSIHLHLNKLVVHVLSVPLNVSTHGDPQGQKRSTDKLKMFFDWNVFLGP